MLIFGNILATYLIDKLKQQQSSGIAEWNEASQTSMLNNKVARKFVVITSGLLDHAHFYYVIYLPVVALAWRRIGYEPIVLFAQPEGSNSSVLINKTRQILKEINVKTTRIESAQRDAILVNKFARFFVGLLPERLINANDFILISDSDTLPISMDLFTFLNTGSINVVKFDQEAKIRYNNRYYDPYPTNYIGMSKKQWQDVFNLRNTSRLKSEVIVKSINQIVLDHDIILDSHQDDRYVITVMLNQYLVQNNVGLQVHRPKGLRLHRDDYPSLWDMILNSKESNLIDCHLFHSEAFYRQYLLVQLYKYLFSQRVVELLEGYTSQLKEIICYKSDIMAC